MGELHFDLCRQNQPPHPEITILKVSTGKEEKEGAGRGGEREREREQ